MSPGLPRGPLRKYQQHLLDTLTKKTRERTQRNGWPKGLGWLFSAWLSSSLWESEGPSATSSSPSQCRSAGSSRASSVGLSRVSAGRASLPLSCPPLPSSLPHKVRTWASS